MLLKVDSFLLYTVEYGQDLQKQPKRVLQVPLPRGLVSEISQEGSGAGH